MASPRKSKPTSKPQPLTHTGGCGATTLHPSIVDGQALCAGCGHYRPLSEYEKPVSS